MTRSGFGPDDWLGLVPEVERLGPGLVARIEGDAAGVALERRIGEVIRRGAAEDWLELLADLGARARDPGDGDPDARVVLAEVLRDQYRLAPGVLVMRARDEETSRMLEQVTGR